MKYARKWRRVIGHRGTVSHIFDGNLHVCVRENLLIRNRPFEVLEYSRRVSGHETLAETKISVLRRLIELAEA
jgi:hypothetical protein